jgi:hypothetical protein
MTLTLARNKRLMKSNWITILIDQPLKYNNGNSKNTASSWEVIVNNKKDKHIKKIKSM